MASSADLSTMASSEIVPPWAILRRDVHHSASGDGRVHRTLIRAFESGVKRRRTFEHLRDLEASQWNGPDELRERQAAAARNLLRHAERHCPYYRDRWRELGLDSGSLRSVDDIRRWPVVDRETFGAQAAGLRADAPGLTRIRKATGGSTGRPLQFELDGGSNDRRVAATFRGYSWAGAGPGTRQLHLWGTALGHPAVPHRLKTRLYEWLYHRRVLDAFGLSDASAASHVRACNEFRPEVIVAYANALYSFARTIEEQGLRPPPLRAIVVGAEKLHAFQREVIERVFAAPVFETYGSREFMLMAAQCERRGGLHVTGEHLIVEVVDDGGQPVPDGVEGRVVVTDLFNYAMPFVRYANGDRAIAGGRCDCGRGLPLLAEVVGRQADILTTPDGRHVSGLYFPHLLKDFPAVRRFQVVQEKLDEVILKLEAPNVVVDDIDRIAALAGSVLGPQIRFSVEKVEAIPLSPAGKLQVVVNKVHRPSSDGASGG